MWYYRVEIGNEFAQAPVKRKAVVHPREAKLAGEINPA
jgi:hypothetical protein